MTDDDLIARDAAALEAERPDAYTIAAHAAARNDLDRYLAAMTEAREELTQALVHPDIHPGVKLHIQSALAALREALGEE